MKSLAFAAALGLSLAAAPILAQTAEGTDAGETRQQAASAQAAANPPVQETAAQEPDPGEEVICRRERATGSLTRVNRVCKTRNEWNGTHANTRDSMNDLQRNSAGGAACRSDAMGGC